MKNRLILFFFIVGALVVGCGDSKMNKANNSTNCDDASMQQLHDAALAGIGNAQNELGWRYESGDCVDRDYKQSANWYRQAAEQGHVNAQKVLGFMYAGGVGVKQDTPESLFWFRKASEQGHPEAQVGLGVAYFRGIGVEKDPRQAAEWFQKSADQDFPRGQYNLGRLYETGDGLPQDNVQAYMWYDLASRGYAKGGTARDKLAEKINESEVAEANRMAANWTAKPKPFR